MVTAVAQGFKVATQIVSVIVLSRLLAPTEFGIVAMCAPVIAFIGLFQDFGLTQATIQKSAIRHEEVNVLFWINLAISAFLACLLAGSAPLIAAFYGEPRVGPFIAATSLQIVVFGFGGQHGALLNRRMEFGRLAVIDVLGGVAGLAVSVAWALTDPSYWALFAGGMTSAVLSTLGVWASSRWRPGLPRRVAGIGGMLNFGAGITGFNFANFFARNLDNVLIGKYWGEAQLGLYDRAYKLLLFPLSQITNPLSKVMIPALSRLTAEPDRYRSAYLRVVPLLLLVALPGVAFATAMADIVIPFVLGEQWRGSAQIFMALGFAGMLQPLNNPSGWLFISQGRSGDFLRWGVVTAVTSILAFVIGLPYGAFGVAAAYAVSEYLKTPLLWWYVCRTGPLRTRDVVRTAGPCLLAGHVALAAVWLLRDRLPSDPIVAMGCGLILAYGLTMLVTAAFPSGREILRNCVGIMRGRHLMMPT